MDGLCAQGFTVSVWVSPEADSKRSICVQVLYLGDGLREHQEGREEAESRGKGAKIGNSALKQVTNHCGRHCGTRPHFVPLRGEGPGPFTHQLPVCYWLRTAPRGMSSPAFLACSSPRSRCSCDLKKAPGRVAGACCEPPSGYGGECQWRWVERRQHLPDWLNVGHPPATREALAA